jgi:hypothetical protein
LISLTFRNDKGCLTFEAKAYALLRVTMDIMKIYLDAHKSQCKIPSTRSKVSPRGFYESFTSNKQCNLYVRNVTSSSCNEFHEEHQRLFLLHLRDLMNSLNCCGNVSYHLIPNDMDTLSWWIRSSILICVGSLKMTMECNFMTSRFHTIHLQ